MPKRKYSLHSHRALLCVLFTLISHLKFATGFNVALIVSSASTIRAPSTINLKSSLDISPHAHCLSLVSSSTSCTSNVQRHQAELTSEYISGPNAASLMPAHTLPHRLRRALLSKSAQNNRCRALPRIIKLEGVNVAHALDEVRSFAIPGRFAPAPMKRSTLGTFKLLGLERKRPWDAHSTPSAMHMLHADTQVAFFLSFMVL